jgi:hypothetical protein
MARRYCPAPARVIVLARTLRLLSPLACALLASACAVTPPPAVSNPPTSPFVARDLPNVAVSASARAAVFDANGDELPDIFITDEQGHDRLFIQQKDGTWLETSVTTSAGTVTTLLAADLNNDFAPDLVLVRNGVLQLWLNDGQGRFREATPPALRAPGAGHTKGVALGDVDGDGWIDIYELRTNAPPRLWLRTPGKTVAYRDATKTAGLDAAAPANVAALADLDNDGRVDLISAGANLELWRNDGRGHFRREVANGLPGPWSTIAIGDDDHDGLLDVFLGGDRGLLLANHGKFQFTGRDVVNDTVAAGAFGNINNGNGPSLVIETMNGLHIAASNAAARPTFGANAPVHLVAVADLNRDGWPDVLTKDAGGHVQAWTTSDQHHWLGVMLRGHDGRATSGARVVVTLRDGTTLTRHQGVSGEELYFGLGRRVQIGTIVVYWPSGKVSQLVDPHADVHLGFIEPTGPGNLQVAKPLLGVITHGPGHTVYCK